jgi:hypothetical protein
MTTELAWAVVLWGAGGGGGKRKRQWDQGKTWSLPLATLLLRVLMRLLVLRRVLRCCEVNGVEWRRARLAWQEVMVQEQGCRKELERESRVAMMQEELGQDVALVATAEAWQSQHQNTIENYRRVTI